MSRERPTEENILGNFHTYITLTVMYRLITIHLQLFIVWVVSRHSDDMLFYVSIRNGEERFEYLFDRPEQVIIQSGNKMTYKIWKKYTMQYRGLWFRKTHII